MALERVLSGKCSWKAIPEVLEACAPSKKRLERAPAAMATKLSLMPQDRVCYLGRSAWGLEGCRRGSALLGPLSSPPAGDRRAVWLFRCSKQRWPGQWRCKLWDQLSLGQLFLRQA